MLMGAHRGPLTPHPHHPPPTHDPLATQQNAGPGAETRVGDCWCLRVTPGERGVLGAIGENPKLNMWLPSLDSPPAPLERRLSPRGAEKCKPSPEHPQHQERHESGGTCRPAPPELPEPRQAPPEQKHK